MKLIYASCLIMLAVACGAPQETAPPRAAILEITAPWASPTPGGVDVSAGYLTIANGTNADDRLISASSPRAARVEIHEMSMDGDVMRMRALNTLPAPAGEDVALAPGGMHLMFFGVTQPFIEGEEIAVQLTFERAGAIEVTLPVRRDAAGN